MTKLLIHRLLSIVPVFFGISIITFCLLRLVPGDPAEIMLRSSGLEPTAAGIAACRESLGLNDPIYLRYARWLQGIVQLDLGTSFYTGEPVMKELMAHAVPTLRLTAGAFVFMVLVSSLVGTLAARYRDRVPDQLARLGSILFASIPAYWLGLVLIYVFSVRLQLLPMMAKGGALDMVLPSISLGLGIAAINSRVIRERLVDAWSLDYTVLAYCKGLSERVILFRHVLRNILAPIVTLWGITLGHLLGGAVIMEMVYSRPGMGMLVMQAVFSRDYPVIQGYVLFMAVVFLCVNFLVDILCLVLDPKQKADIQRKAG